MKSQNTFTQEFQINLLVLKQETYDIWYLKVITVSMKKIYVLNNLKHIYFFKNTSFKKSMFY